MKIVHLQLANKNHFISLVIFVLRLNTNKKEKSKKNSNDHFVLKAKQLIIDIMTKTVQKLKKFSKNFLLAQKPIWKKNINIKLIHVKMFQIHKVEKYNNLQFTQMKVVKLN